MENIKVVQISTRTKPEEFNISVSPEDTIILRSDGETQAVVVIPNIKAYADREGKDNYREHYFPDNPELKIVISKYPIFGEFPYHIYFVKEKKFVDIPNNSAPKIIIKE
ncbi:MAG: hypothetical protein JSW33_01680 [bacterium]|nr:MAG: hypothetical protein JSW33_01680 [bacterium]